MRKLKSVLFICTLVLFIISFAGCTNSKDKDITTNGGHSQAKASVSEDNFEWDGNIIIALTEKGAKQESIVIPERCDGFNGMIFADIENKITSVYFESDKDIDLNGVFSGAEKIEFIDLPDQITNIGDLEFWLCSNLKKIEIPEGVLTIGEYAFQDNFNLCSVSFAGNTEAIKAHAFDGCSSLSEIVLPDTLSLIEEYAFFECTSLKTITLPDNLKRIGEFSFANSGIESVIVSSGACWEEFYTTSFVQTDHDVNIYISKGSWMDQNFESVFNGAFNKCYE